VNKVKEQCKEKANTKLVDRAIEYFSGAQTPDQKDIFIWMMRECKAGNNYYPGTFKMKQYVEEVCLKLQPEDRLDEYLNSEYHKIFRY